jgi:hypothetical protein
LFKVGQYVVFFWSNEEGEPIHVHISKGKITPNATKIWLTAGGGCIIAKKGRIPANDLSKLFTIIQDNHSLICSKWRSHFDVEDIKFYC